jgi:hypothetical protein
MFSEQAIAALAGVSVGFWAYSKLSRSTGGNAMSAGIAGAVAGLFVFVILLSILSLIF